MNDEIYRQFYLRLWKLCLDSGMKTAKLAKASEVSEAVIQAIMQQKLLPDLPTAIRLARALGTTVDEMCSRAFAEKHSGSFYGGGTEIYAGSPYKPKGETEHEIPMPF